MAANCEYPTSPVSVEDAPTGFSGRKRTRSTWSADARQTSSVTLPDRGSRASRLLSDNYSVVSEEFDSDDEDRVRRLFRRKTRTEIDKSRSSKEVSGTSAVTKETSSQARVSGSARGRRDGVQVPGGYVALPAWQQKSPIELDATEVRDDLDVLSGKVPFAEVSMPRYRNPLHSIVALRSLRIPATSRPRRNVLPSLSLRPSGPEVGPTIASTVTTPSTSSGPDASIVDAGNGQFCKHPTRKGWFSCRQCGEAVWPPNGRKHTATCEWTG